MMKWISALLFLIVAQLAFSSEVPVSIAGPVPAVPNTVYPGFNEVVSFTITNNVPKVLPLNISSASGLVQLSRVSVANDCGDYIPKGPTTCTLGIDIAAPYGQAVGPVTNALNLDYEGRAPLAGDISFTILPILSVTGSPLALYSGLNGIISVTNVSQTVTAQNVTAVFTGTALEGNATVTVNTCMPELAPGDSCTITIEGGGTTAPSTNINIEGTNTEAEIAAISVTALTVGEAFGGGIVGCSTASGNPITLIAASTDIASLSTTQLPWGTYTATTGATSTTNGLSNTNKIIMKYGTAAAYAAVACATYQVDSAGNTPCVTGNTCYESWYLPSVNELECIAGNYNTIGGFDNTQEYWSSTELNSANADAIDLNTPTTPISVSKTNTTNVRCVSQSAAQ